MRVILISALLLLGAVNAPPEPELFGNNMRGDHASTYELVGIESASYRGDRLSLATLQPRALHVEVFRRDNRNIPLKLASLGPELNIEGKMDYEPSGEAGESSEMPSVEPSPLSLDNLCNTLFTSAQDNDLPVPFFANLLWQESRLRNDVVSKKGAVASPNSCRKWRWKLVSPIRLIRCRQSPLPRVFCKGCGCSSAISASWLPLTMPARVASSNGLSIVAACRAKPAATCCASPG